MQNAWFPMLVAVASGCLSIPGKTPCDEDQDGYLAAICADTRGYPADCDDREADVYPGAYDTPGNDTNEDCVGELIGLSAADAIPTLTTVRTGGSQRVNSSAVALTFDGQRGFTPSELRVIGAGDRNLLYTNAANNERFMGVALWPTFLTHTTNVDPILDQLSSNRAVSRFHVTWSVGDPTTRAEGSTIYTIHPDGRIHVDSDLELLVMLTGGNNWLATYIAMDPTRINRVRTPDESTRTLGISAEMFYDPETSNENFICAWHDVSRDRLTWVYGAPADEVPIVGPRASENGLLGDPSHQVAMQFDWIRAGDAMADTYRSNVIVLADIAGESDACAGGLGFTSFLHAPPQLSVTAPARLITDSVGDDDADGYNEGGGFHVVDAGDTDAIEIAIANNTAAAAAPTATIRLTGLAWTRPPIVTLDGNQLEHGSDYLAEADVSGDGGWLFFSAPLPDGATLLVREAATFTPGI